VLVAAAGLKLAGGASARAAFTTYGLRNPRAAWAVWAGLIAVELKRALERDRDRRQRETVAP